MPATALCPPLVPRHVVVTALWSVLVLFLAPVLVPAAVSVGVMARGLTTIASGLSGGGKIDPGLPQTGDTPVDVVISGAPQQAAGVPGCASCSA